MSSTAPEQPWTVGRLIQWTREYLAGREVDSPRLAAEVLLAHVLDCERIALYARYDFAPTAEQLSQYREWVRRAAAHEPVAYLVGCRQFYSLEFVVTPDVLIPRPETELLVDQAVEHLRPLGEAGRYWDACTGSGAVAVATASQVAAGVVLATDTSEPALAVTRRNVEAHGLSSRITVAVADLLQPPAEIADGGLFDAITVNPPYVSDAQMAELPANVRHEPASALAAGADGLAYISPILEQAAGVLTDNGLLGMEIGAGQAEAVWELAQKSDRYERVRFVRDLAGIERVLVAYQKS